MRCQQMSLMSQLEFWTKIFSNFECVRDCTKIRRVSWSPPIVCSLLLDRSCNLIIRALVRTQVLFLIVHMHTFRRDTYTASTLAEAIDQLILETSLITHLIASTWNIELIHEIFYEQT